MPSAAVDPAQIILPFINKCVAEVFSTMTSLATRAGSGEEQPARPALFRGVTGSVSLTGRFTGVVYTNFSEELALTIAQRILGGNSVSDCEVSDVVGELTNMITGNLKSQMADRGFNCLLSIPSVMRGASIAVDSREAHVSVRNTYYFAELNETLTVQVFARLD